VDAQDVLVLSPHVAPPPGGVQRLTLNMADALAPARVRVVGVADAAGADPRVRTVVQRRGPLGGPTANLRYAVAAIAELRRRPQLVQAMTWRAALPAVLLPTRAPVVLYCHGAELRRGAGARLRRLVLRRVDAIVANSEFTAGIVRDIAGRTATLVHPPVAAVPPDIAPRRASREIAVLSVGRLVANKGHDRLLRTVARARAAGEEVSVTIVGAGPDHAALEALIDELGLRGVARLAGAVSDDELEALYRQADVFALLSAPVGDEVEGFGIVFLEANSYGLPVIAGRSGGSQEAVVNGKSGIVVDGEDAAVAALTALAHDPTLRAALGDYGRARLADFTLERFGEQMRAVYAAL
jgi:phosphatidylinositol alpha-1,6-mannosyltransferase